MSRSDRRPAPSFLFVTGLWIASAGGLASCGEDAVEIAEDAEGVEATAQPTVQEPVEPERIDKGDGLVFEVREAGDGKVLRKGHVVVLHYRARLAESGVEFDSTYSRHNPDSLTLGTGELIAGFERGLPGLRVGTKGVLHIPAALAWGEEGVPRLVPENADIEYEIDIRQVR